jgi:transposase InsO family protein
VLRRCAEVPWVPATPPPLIYRGGVALHLSRGNSPKRLAGSTHPSISFAIVIGPMAKSLPRVRSMGIRDRPTAPRSPWQNEHAERLIGSIRRECLDHVVVFGERHLRHLLRSYHALLQRRTHTSVSGQGRAPTAGCSCRRTHSADTNSWRIAPSICSDRISDRDRHLPLV